MISELKLITPEVFSDDRGYFFEAFHAEKYANNGMRIDYIQDNVSYSKKNVIRGLHFQKEQFNQAKLVYCPHGEIYDVAVDLRKESTSFKKWYAFVLSHENKHQLFIPAGFAHGFCVLSEEAVVAYKTTSYYLPQAEVAVRWNDPQIGVEWPVTLPILSKRDQEALLLKDILEF